MDRILYILVGIGVVAAMVSAFGTRPGFRPVGKEDVALVAGHWIDWRLKKRVNEEDAEVHANARNNGEVRKPRCWWYW